MIVTLSAFRTLARDEQQNILPLGKDRAFCQARTTAGSFTALDADISLIRIATDTAIRMDIEGGTSDTSDELIPAGVEFFAVDGGETFSFIAA